MSNTLPLLPTLTFKINPKSYECQWPEPCPWICCSEAEDFEDYSEEQ